MVAIGGVITTRSLQIFLTAEFLNPFKSDQHQISPYNINAL